jgi:hypothetical protein
MIDQKTIGNKIEDKTRIHAAEARCTPEQTNNNEGRARDLQICKGLCNGSVFDFSTYRELALAGAAGADLW